MHTLYIYMHSCRDKDVHIVMGSIKNSFPFLTIQIPFKINHLPFNFFLGSAFVQFKEVSSAQSCLEVCSSQEHGITYGGQRLEVTFALSRGEVERVCGERGAEGRRTRGEDKRNLYLAKEGGLNSMLDILILCLIQRFIMNILSIKLSFFSDLTWL